MNFISIKKIVYFLIFLSFVHPTIDCSNKNASQKYFIITPGEKRESIGFFANVFMVIGHLYNYEKGKYENLSGMEIDFGDLGMYYDPQYGPNWWNYYFEPIQLGLPKGNIITTEDPINVKAWLARRELTRKEAHRIVKKYIHPKKHILEKVELFAKEHFNDCTVIGVHYRGTDKFKEAPRVPYHEANRVISQEIAKINGNYKIYVATDETNFLDYMRNIYGDKILSIEAARTTGEVGVHHLQLVNPHDLGEQALLDSLLLSKCDLLIRTSSNLSLFSTYYSLSTPQIQLSVRRFAKRE